jgi:hypothetical protein
LHSFLPLRNGIVPNTLYVLLHVSHASQRRIRLRVLRVNPARLTNDISCPTHQIAPRHRKRFVEMSRKHNMPQLTDNAFKEKLGVMISNLIPAFALQGGEGFRKDTLGEARSL